MEEKEYGGMIAQFIEIQRKYPHAVVLTEVGKFFEIWELDDLKLGHAIRASQILDITLTRRSKKDSTSPRMAGFPATNASEYYIKKLVDAGETVVVVRQEITGKKSDQNKNVKRSIERIISPGTSVYQGIDNKPHYFASVYNEGDYCGVCLIDLSTGEVRISEMSKEESKIFIENNDPIEILFCQEEEFINKKDKQIFHHLKTSINRQSSAGVVLAKIYDIDNPSSNHSVVLSKIGIELWPMASLALVNLLNFLVDYNALLLKKISKPSVERINDSLFISKNGFLSLDIFESPLEKDESKTLYGSLNRCKTAMGRRILRKWIQHPLVDLNLIKERHDRVQQFIDKKAFLEELKEVYDISRLTRRLALRNLIPHEIISFNNSIDLSQKILVKHKITHPVSKKVLNYIQSNIDLSLVESTQEEFGFFKGKLEDKVVEERSEWLEAKEKLDKRTEEISKLLDTDKLRISMNKESIQLVGPKGLHSKCKEKGIHFKVKTSELQVADGEWEELASKEFYLKRKFILKAEKEWANFQTDTVEKFGEEILDYANLVGEIDVLSNFAQIATERHYTRPLIKDTDKPFVNVKSMRHPVVELSKELSESFVANDLKLDQDKNLMVIYGANSAGKSTILKSLAINIIMAQIGSFVACNEGSEISLFDSIMTRMTTYDSLSEGLSTFTMEMIELQSALSKHKERSLFLFDEIGRGTSADDGEAIAFAVLEFLKPETTNAITLFSTHYHSLYENIKSFKNLLVKHMAGRVENGILSFSRSLLDGPGEGSYGIMVAKSCGIPESIVRVAENYNKENKKLMVSRYNSSIQGTICEFCKEEQAQETHHLIEQHQGRVEKISINGTTKSIHDKGNLVLLCATCHSKITQEKIKITKNKVIGKGSDHFELKIEEVSQKDPK